MLAAMDDVLAVPLSTMPVDDLGDWVCVVESAVNAKTAALRKQLDGSFTGDFKLDPVTGQAVNTAVSREYQRIYKSDTEQNIDRAVPARWAAAFANIMMRGANPTGANTAAPLVHIVLGEQLAEELTAKLIESDPTPIETSASDPNRRCEFIDGTPLHPDHAAAILAVGKLRRLVFGPGDAILNLGDDTRMFSPRLKQALLVAARGRCQITGCDAPFPWLQADHIIPANKHGPTNITNGFPSVEFRRRRNSQGTRRVPIHTTSTKKISSCKRPRRPTRPTRAATRTWWVGSGRRH